MADQSSSALTNLLHGAGQRLLVQHKLSRCPRPSPLDALVGCVAGPATVEQGPLRPWAELMIRSYWACGGEVNRRAERRALEIAVAALVVGMSALEILDDLIDGDEPAGGQQGPNLALVCIGESMALLSRLPSQRSVPMLACWGESWVHCAAAQARDAACSAERNLTVEQAVAVAAGSGSFTRWAVETGAVMAGARKALRTPLAEFGQQLGAAEKLLHDIHDLWPGSRPSRDLRRPTCNPALVIARLHDAVAPPYHSDVINDDLPRRRILESGALHYAWAYADQYRLQAADALARFAHVGGDPTPLTPVLALSPELAAIREDDVVERFAFSGGVP